MTDLWIADAIWVAILFALGGLGLLARTGARAAVRIADAGERYVRYLDADTKHRDRVETHQDMLLSSVKTIEGAVHDYKAESKVLN